MSTITLPAVGDRVRLVNTTDAFARIKAGDVGTVDTVIRVWNGAARVRWDHGPCTTLLPHLGDRWEVITR